MEDFDIHDYLQDYDSITRRGTCKSCFKSVIWKRDRVSSHKRVNCDAASAEERIYFSSKKHEGSFKRSRDESFGDDDQRSTQEEQATGATKDEKDSAFGNLFYRTGISFRIAESEAMRTFVKSLDPDYAKNIPSSKSLGSRLLNRKYDETRAKIDNILKDAENLTLMSDGWSNVRGEHIVNFIVKAPERAPFFYSAINTTGISQDAEEIASAIFEVLEEIGAEKFIAVVTDNAAPMKAAWRKIEERYQHISAYGCAAHFFNLLIKDMTAMHSKALGEASKIIRFINNHHIVRFKFDEKRKEAGISRKLSTSVPTRFYSEYTSAKSLFDAKLAVTRLARENSEELESIQPKSSSLKVVNLMRSDDFWNRLEALVNELEFPANIIGKVEANDAPLYLVYNYFGQMLRFMEDNLPVQEKIKKRWETHYSELSCLAYVLVPRFAVDGIFKDQDKIDVIGYVTAFADRHFNGTGQVAADELIQYMSKIASMTGSSREIIWKMDSKQYWNIFGRTEFPNLYKCAKLINEMICSSAASERVWSIFGFIHSRLRNRLTDDKVTKLAFIYVNCAILDADKTDYMSELGAVLSGMDCEDADF